MVVEGRVNVEESDSAGAWGVADAEVRGAAEVRATQAWIEGKLCQSDAPHAAGESAHAGRSVLC